MSKAHVNSGSGCTARVPGGSRFRADSDAPIVVRNFGDPYTGPTTVTPDETVQTLETENKFVQSDITIEAIPGDFVGDDVPRMDSDDLTVSGDTVTAPAGYYETGASKAVAAGSAAVPDTEITATVSASVGSSGLVTATASATDSIAPVVTPGYVSSGTAGEVTVAGSGTLQLDTQAATTITPTTAEQTAVAAGKFTTGAVKVAAMPNATWKSGSTVQTTPTVSVDSLGIVTATVSDTKSVTPIQTGGYADSSATYPVTLTGTGSIQLDAQTATTITPSTSSQTAVAAGKFTTGAVTVDPIPSEYIIPTGTKSITANGTGIDVAQYADVDVAVPAPPPTLQTKSATYTPSTSQQTATITADAGYDGLDEVDITVNAMPSGTEGTPTATKGAVSNHSISVTPSVTNSAGYISGGTKTGTAVTVSASELVSGTLSITSSGTKDVTNYASASVAAGTEGTPTATKGAVSNHAVSVTPSVTNSAGYISGGTKTGAAVSVSASELVSGTKTISTNGTGIDVADYATVDVDVPSGGGGIVVTDTLDSHGGIIREITAVDLSNDTVDAAHLLSGYTAHDSTGTVVNGTLVIQHYYTGSGAPSSSTGVDGDIYLQTS